MLTAARNHAPILALVAIAAASLVVARDDGRAANPAPLPVNGPTPAISLLTYNVHGLPWPLASGRPAALAAIAGRLRALRTTGAQPHIVVLQEAFTGAAKRIGREAGYPYAAFGPSAAMRSAFAASAADRRFEAGASRLKGEADGKLADSGLVILSDYPIERVRMAAYPDFACAGYDCLANKGVLLAELKLPGRTQPLQVATTHLVSRFAADVADARNFYAYRRELDTLGIFLRANADPAMPLILAGDFNVGIAPGRQGAMLGAISRTWTGLGYGTPADAMRSCLRLGLACQGTASPDAALSLARARDWQLVGSGVADRLRVTRIRILFGQEPGGRMLSDHVGYEADYAQLGRGMAASASA